MYFVFLCSILYDLYDIFYIGYMIYNVEKILINYAI